MSNTPKILHSSLSNKSLNNDTESAELLKNQNEQLLNPGTPNTKNDRRRSIVGQLQGMVMGTAASRAAKCRSKEIDDQLKKEAASKRATVLLMGPLHAGKTTVMKQLSLNYGDGFSQVDRIAHREEIQQVVLDQFKLLLNEMDNRGIEFPMELKDKKQSLMNQEAPDYQTATLIIKIWENAEFQKCVPRTELVEGFEDTTIQWIERTREIFGVDYLPSDNDLLLFRNTEQINESKFSVDDFHCTVIDVYGNKDHRERWKVYFEDKISSLIFVASAASYCQTTEQNRDSNPLADALEQFSSLLENEKFKFQSVMVFINKIDLLEERLLHCPVSEYIPAYQGENEKGEFLRWLWKAFKQKAEAANIPVYMFSTIAIDTKLMKKVFSSMIEALLAK